MIALFVAALIGTCYGAFLPANMFELFHAEDTNNDGILTIDEVFVNGDGTESRHAFTMFLCEHAPDLSNLGHDLFDYFDANGDHHLQYDDYVQLFNKMDTNNDGQVTMAEYEAYGIIGSTMIALFLAALIGTCYGGLLPDQAFELFHAGDGNADGNLTIAEVTEEFKKLDLNGDGTESRHEFTMFICENAPDLYNLGHYLFDDFDVNGDHHLQYEDYVQMFNKMDTNHDGVVTLAEYEAYALTAFLLNSFKGTHAHNSGACHAG